MPEGLTGNLAQMPIGDMVRMLTAAGQSGRLDLADRGDRGAIYLRDGAIVHATHGPASGETALRHLMTWASGAFRFEAQAASPEVTIHRPAAELLAEIAAMAAERDAIRKAIPDLDARIEAGDLKPVFDWLEANIWRHGSRYETDELLRRATGEPLNPAHFRAHLESRYLRD